MIIDLDGAMPVARGGKRAIYLHPDDPSQIIKVITDRRQAKQAARGLRELLYKPPYEWEFMREISTVYRASLRARRAGVTRLPVIATAGLVQTSKGLGLSCEKIVGPEGRLAPTLGRLMASHRFTGDHLDRLNVFAAHVFALGIVASDLHLNNIVWSETEDAFVAIDGFGSRTLIPVMVWSRWANDRQLNDTFTRKIAERSALTWDARARRFAVDPAAGPADPGAGASPPPLPSASRDRQGSAPIEQNAPGRA